MTLEEYIVKRKREDGINKYDLDKRLENTRICVNYVFEYDYKQKSNLFGLDTLYRNMPRKSFIKGRKQEFEATLMYYWLHDMYSDNECWEEYSQKVL